MENARSMLVATEEGKGKLPLYVKEIGTISD
jgi:hypothetical protein